IAFTGYIGACCISRGGLEWVDVYVINADGSGPRRLTGVRERPAPSLVLPGTYGDDRLEPASSSPVWWPHGSRPFFAAEPPPPPGGRLFIMNADGTCETPYAVRDTPVPPDAASPLGPAPARVPHRRRSHVSTSRSRPRPGRTRRARCSTHTSSSTTSSRT